MPPAGGCAASDAGTGIDATEIATNVTPANDGAFVIALAAAGESGFRATLPDGTAYDDPDAYAADFEAIAAQAAAQGQQVTFAVTESGELGTVAQALGRRDADEDGETFAKLIEQLLCVVVPRQLLMQTRRRGVDLVHLRAERQDVKQRVEELVAHFLDQIRRAAVAHERRAHVTADDGPGE